MKEIPLTQGKVALVDDEDYDFLMQWKWVARKRPHTYYVERSIYLGGGRRKPIRKTIIMHRVIMKTPPGMEVDHIDHNGLNCQKSNLRNCTHNQNARNIRASGISKFLGVSIRRSGKSIGQIISQITINKKKIHLGCFNTEEDAARAYDKKAKELFGEFANLNFRE